MTNGSPRLISRIVTVSLDMRDWICMDEGDESMKCSFRM